MSKLLIALACLFTATSAYGKKPKLKVCLAGTTVKIIPAYGEAFLNGARLAASQFKNIDVEVVESFYDPTPLAPRRAMQQMNQKNCHAVLGFTSTNDLLAASTEIKKSGTFVLSMYGELNDTLKKIPQIKTMQLPPESLFAKVGGYLKSTNKVGKNVLIATVIDRESLVDYKTHAKKFFQSEGANVYTVDIIERSFDASKFRQEMLRRNKQIDTVVLLTRSTIGAKLTDIVYEIRKGKNLPTIVGTKNFGSSKLSAYQSRLKNKDVNVFIARQNSFLDPDPKYQAYIKSFQKKFNKDPMVISGLSYDATKFIGEAAEKFLESGGKIESKSDLFEALSLFSYKGITGISIAKGLKVTYTKSFVLEISKDGYQIVRPKSES